MGPEHRSSPGLGETETPLLEGAHKFSGTLRPTAKALTAYKPGPDLPAGLGESPGEAGGLLWLTVGTKTLAAEVLGNNHQHELPWRPPFGGQNPAPANAHCRLQCWEASGQTTKRVGTQPHASADRLPKDFPRQPSRHAP